MAATELICLDISVVCDYLMNVEKLLKKEQKKKVTFVG
jgi:hypothetical protein